MSPASNVRYIQINTQEWNISPEHKLEFTILCVLRQEYLFIHNTLNGSLCQIIRQNVKQ